MAGPVALVTGGARRVGAAVVEALAARGADVVVHHHRSRAEAEALAERVREAGAEAWAVEADLRDERAAAGLVPRAAARAGRPVAVLVSGASAFPESTPLAATWRDVEESLRLHHWAPLVLMRALAGQGAPASVVNVLDATRPEHDASHFAYQVGKSALAALTRVMALALAPSVRVNAVAPGAVLPAAGADARRFEALARSLPLRATGAPRDVADAVAYLAFAPFVTGTTLVVDGGAHLLGGVSP